MEFRLLGPVQVSTAGEVLRLTGAMVPAVLATLLVNANRTVSVDQLVETAWTSPPRAVRSNVRTYIARIRGALLAAGEAQSRLITEPAGYRLTVAPGELDVTTFEELAAQGEQALAHADAEVGLDRLRRAIDLWRGHPLDGVAGGPQLNVEVARLCERRVVVTQRWADIALEAGRHDEAAVELARLTRAEPLREQIWMRLMLALYRGGRQAAALAAYQEVYQLLDRELGIAPGRALQQLQHRILTADPALDPPEANQFPAEQITVRPTAFPVPKPRQLPPDVATFTGRVEQLVTLDALLPEMSSRPGAPPQPGMKRPSSIVVISGAPGVGKTTLAVHWAHLVADRLADGQLYVNLRGFDPSHPTVDPAKTIRGFLDALGVPPERVPEDLDAQAALYRSLLATRRVLVLLDNARDAEQVLPLLPGAPECPVVVTSRNQLPGLVATIGARPMTLDLLTDDEARDLLRQHLGTHRIAAEPAAVDSIITLCARLPLALAVIAARAAAHPDYPLRALADELRSAWAGGDAWDGLDGRGSLDPFSGGDPLTDVRAVFSSSYRTLDAAEARLFRLLSLHPGPDFAISAAASLAGAPAAQVRPLLARLTRAHLLTGYAPGRYCFHDLIRAYAAELAHTVESEVDRHAAIGRVLDHYLHTARAADRWLDPHREAIPLAPLESGVAIEQFGDSVQALAWFTIEHSALLAAVRQAAAGGFDAHAWQLAWALATFLDRRDHWSDQDATHRLALDASQRLADPVAQAHAHRLVARAAARVGLDDESGAHLRHALHLFGRLGDRVGEARMHLGLGWVAEQQGKQRLALNHDLQALDLFRAAGHRAGQARALNAAGWDYAELGEYQQALAHCEEALVLQKEIGDRRGEADTCDTLGHAHHRLGQYQQALRRYRYALEVFRDLGSRYYEAETLDRLGDTYDAAGEPAAARHAWRQALEILDDLGHAGAGPLRGKLGLPCGGTVHR